MTYDEFIEIVNFCPICGEHMVAERLDILKKDSNYPHNLFIVSFACIKHTLHYESYSCEIDTLEHEDVKINAISMHINMYSASWFDDTKEFCLRDPRAEIIVKVKYENRTSLDWLTPHKNIMDKAKSLFMLSSGIAPR